MLNMNFYDGTLNKKDLIDFIRKTNKPIVYTHGLGLQGPLKHNPPIDKNDALKVINNYKLLDIKENEKYIHLKSYNGTDMWESY